jgi:hypothetical protein
MAPSQQPSNLKQLSTHWSSVHEPARFVARYSSAIRKYLITLMGNEPDADEVLQSFLLGVVRHGFPRAAPGRGRFRDYLFVSVRHAAVRYLQRQQADRHRRAAVDVGDVPVPDPMDARWLAEWHQCVLTRALASLHHHQRRSAGSIAHTVLAVRIEYPDAEMEFLAQETSRRCGRPIRTDAYRQQLRRTRFHFARFLIEEVARTLDQPTPERVEEELIEVGLIAQVRPYLPDTFWTEGTLPSDQGA